MRHGPGSIASECRPWPNLVTSPVVPPGVADPANATDPANDAESLPGWLPRPIKRDRCHGQSERRRVGLEDRRSPPRGNPAAVRAARSSLFFLNLLQTGLYKPMQGWYARLYTALGLGVIAAAGVWRVYESSIEYTPLWRLGIPAALALVLGWVIFRIVHFPPFAEFLIATEAEMNKVSWTSKEDLYRATTVVLATVLLMAVFLFVVDWLWLFILRNIGVLQFTGGGGFGSTA